MSDNPQLFEAQIEFDMKVGGRGSNTPDIECKLRKSGPMDMPHLLEFIRNAVQDYQPEVARITILPFD